MKLRFVSFIADVVFGCRFGNERGSRGSCSATVERCQSDELSGTHSPDLLPTGKNSPPPSGEANTDDIDTRITVQPHGPSSGKPGKVGEHNEPDCAAETDQSASAHFLPVARRQSLAPNASGFPGPQHQNVQQNLGQRFEYQGLGQRGTGGGGGGGVGLAKPGSPFGRQQVFQPSSISPIAGGSKTLIRGGIGGANLNRRVAGSGTSGIGGPTRTVTGINGSSIRRLTRI